MRISKCCLGLAGALCLLLAVVPVQSADGAQPGYEPVTGQEGKDVVWVPTPPVTVEKMLDLAKLKPGDFVMDLGSGDGRNIIAAAKRGARAVGVEFNSDMVDYATRSAEKAGVANRAKFVQGDMFTADISQATVLALFLLPDNLSKLAPRFMELRSGTRIVVNTFGIPGWEADETARAEDDCGAWCLALLYLVPARVEGTWRLGQGELELEQKYQQFSGTLTINGVSKPISRGKLKGEQITFTADNVDYTGRVQGDRMEGRATGRMAGAWSASRGQ
jgi:SAM-dependent methyltransferase